MTSHDSHDNHKHLNEISFSEFKEKTNQKKFNPFAFNVDKNKRLNENLYFRVDTTVVKQNTLTNGKVNFTLRALSMQPESEDVFYNIIYYNKDEKWHWSILEIPNNFMTQEKTSIKEVLNSINGANNLINSKLVGTWVTTTSYHCNGEGKCATGECDGCNVCVSTSISYEYVDLPNTEEYYFVIAPTPGGGGGGGGMSAEQKALNSFINSLNIQQLNIFYNHPELAEYLLNNIVESPRFELINPGTGNGGIGIYDPNPTPQLPEYGFSDESINFVNWALNFLADNPNVTSSQFQNWFMSEIVMGEYYFDSNFWLNSNLNFETQDLPSWQAFNNAYPNESSAQLYGVVGGEVAQAQIDYPTQTQNGCALKVSRALNYSGIVIPYIPNSTLLGGDDKYYFLNARALNLWMRETFGTGSNNLNHLHLTAQDGGHNGEDFSSLIDLSSTGNPDLYVKGIYSMVATQPNNWGASGHADILYDNGECKAGCYFNGPVDYIDIWILD